MYSLTPYIYIYTNIIFNKEQLGKNSLNVT